MVASVNKIGSSIAGMSKANDDMGRATKIRRIDDLRAQRYHVALAMASATAEEKLVHEIYSAELSTQIENALQELNGSTSPAASSSPPGTLQR